MNVPKDGKCGVRPARRRLAGREGDKMERPGAESAPRPEPPKGARTGSGDLRHSRY